MLRSDYKYSRGGPADSATGRRDNSGICCTGDGGRQTGLALLLAPGAEAAEAADNEGGGSSGGGSKRGGSMKHWSPLAALGKRARDGLRRCNTVRTGLGEAGGDGASSSTSASATPAAAADSALGTRRNAMPNIFLGLPSSGVRRLFAIYGIDDTRGSRPSAKASAPYSASPATSSPRAAATTPPKCEESLFARHSRTASVRSRRPPNYAGPMQQQQYQHMLMMQQHQQHLLLPPGCAPQQPTQQQSNSGGHVLDKRRASSMRDHQGRQHRKASSCYGNW